MASTSDLVAYAFWGSCPSHGLFASYGQLWIGTDKRANSDRAICWRDADLSLGIGLSREALI